jgi:hypothetical protein
MNSYGTWSGTRTVQIFYGTLVIWKGTINSGINNFILEDLFIPQKFATTAHALTFVTSITSGEGSLRIAVEKVNIIDDPTVNPVVILNQNVTSSATSNLIVSAGNKVVVKCIMAVNLIGAAGNLSIGRGLDTSWDSPAYYIIPINGNQGVIITDEKINFGYSDTPGENQLKIMLNGTNNVNVVAFGYFIG